MYTEDDFIPVSAVSHMAFCERRCALLHIEFLYDENRFVVEGAQLHEQVHDAPATESRGDVRIARGLMLRSERYGLSGRADAVEFHRVGSAGAPAGPGVSLSGVEGLWVPFPVEYKHGKLREEESYMVQVCAQALCLEEMLSTSISAGAIFYGEPRRRLDVAFGPELRANTEQLIEKAHRLLEAEITPQARYEPKCRSCSLLALCMPKTTGSRRNVARYLEGAFVASEEA